MFGGVRTALLSAKPAPAPVAPSFDPALDYSPDSYTPNRSLFSPPRTWTLNGQGAGPRIIGTATAPLPAGGYELRYSSAGLTVALSGATVSGATVASDGSTADGPHVMPFTVVTPATDIAIRASSGSSGVITVTGIFQTG
jgi:hypothetical protein